jgi:hypothetical protein
MSSLAGRYDNSICRTDLEGYMAGGIVSSESIPGLHKRLQIRALASRRILSAPILYRAHKFIFLAKRHSKPQKRTRNVLITLYWNLDIVYNFPKH